MYTSFITDDRNRRRFFFRRSICQTKSDDRVGHLNTILARGGGNLNDPIFKSSNARGLFGRLGGGGMLKFRFDRRIRPKTQNLRPIQKLTNSNQTTKAWTARKKNKKLNQLVFVL